MVLSKVKTSASASQRAYLCVLAYLGNIVSRQVPFQAPGFLEVAIPRCISPPSARSAAGAAESPSFRVWTSEESIL